MSIAIIIIFFHHLKDYIINFYNLNNFGINADMSFINTLNRYFGLGIFIFISGFLLEFNNQGIKGFKGVVNFLSKRYIRIIPLYFIAYCCFIFLFRNTIDHLNFFSILVHLLGLQVILSSKYCDPVQTLWYVGLILGYYYIFTIISQCGNSKIRMSVVICLIVVLWLLGKMFLGIGDYRFILYLPVFISGIISARTELLEKINLKRFLFSFFSLVVIATMYIVFIYPKTVLFIPAKPALFSKISFADIIILNVIMFLTVINAYFLSKLSKNIKQSKFIGFISYSSFCVYLFHRPILTILLQIYCPADKSLKALYVIFCGLPLVLIAGYFIQKQYDSFFLPKIKNGFKPINLRVLVCPTAKHKKGYSGQGQALSLQ
ncbi:MAG: acyltransferase family protein [Candidatus Desantisbacteria bacterium]